MRVLKWVIDRCGGKAQAVKTPLGFFPDANNFDLEGLSMDRARLNQLFAIDAHDWLDAADHQTELFSKFGSRLPQALLEEQQALIQRLKS